MMADETILGGAALDVAIDTETHVDLIDRHDPVHGFNRPVTFLAGYPCPDVGLVHKFDKVGQRIDTVPPDFERRLMIIGPWACDGLYTAQQRAAMTADAALERAPSSTLRGPYVFMPVL